MFHLTVLWSSRGYDLRPGPGGRVRVDRLDVLAAILAINALPHELVWPVRLAGNVLSGVWLVATSAVSRRWPIRIVGVIIGLDLGLYSFVAPTCPS